MTSLLAAIVGHFPILQVVVPLVSAPLLSLLAFLRIRGLAWILATSVSLITTLIAATLLASVWGGKIISYEVGGWAAPWGIEYRIDTLSALLLLIVSAISTVTLVYGRSSVLQEVPEDRHPLFYTAWMLCVTGLLGMAVTGDAFNIFVFLEISSLSSYVLIAAGKRREALTAAYRYLILGTIGATFFLIGVGLIYMMTGTLNIADMAEKIVAVRDTRAIKAAAAFLTVGLALKFALFPLHLWLPGAYTFAPSTVSAFLAATATKVSIYVLLRFDFIIFGQATPVAGLHFSQFLMPLSLAAIFAGSIAAVFQTNLKRLLAYSSVAQIGYIVLGISFANENGLTGGIVHMFNHAITKGALFMAVGAMIYRLGSAELHDLRGLGRRMPLTAFAFFLGGISLIGVPFTAGFISKWYLISAALDGGNWPIAGLLLISSLIAVVYVWRVIEVFYFTDPPDNARMREAPALMLAMVVLMAGAIIYFGLDTRLSVGAASEAARILLSGGLP